MNSIVHGRTSSIRGVSYSLVSGWRWVDRFRHKHDPKRMETRHLFYSLRMIWNNFMPEYMQVGDVKLYDFTYHTPEYMAQAVVHFVHELELRDDMEEDWKNQYWQMKAFFADWTEVSSKKIGNLKLIGHG